MNNNLRINYVDNSNDEMGIDINEKCISLYLPRSFRVENNEKENNRNYLLFLRSLSLTDSRNSDNYKVGNHMANSIWPFDAYVFIIKDFLENGYYFNRDKQYSINSGKIEWRKTLKKVPIYSNGNFIYNELVTSKMHPTNDVITEIYKICLKDSLDKIGWLFNNINIGFDIKERLSRKEMVSIVNKELNNTFDDVKRTRFINMLKILNDGDSLNLLSKEYKLKVNNYYYIYEQMVDKFFNGLKDTKEYNPNGSWSLINDDGSYRKEDATSLRPDTILVKDDYTYILDAKMYKYGFTHKTSDLPSSQSIQKQLTYGDYVNKFKNKKARNAFILPYNKITDFNNDYDYLDKDKNLAYIGYAEGKWRNEEQVKGEQENKEQAKDHDKIYTFLIDFNYLLNNYNKKENKEINSLCDKIEDLIENL